jgi:histidyl-tRNA synthetase
MAQGALPGFRDFYPPDYAERAFIFETWRSVAQRFGFVEYDGPPLEPLELYTRKSGDEIVGQLYNFTDKGGRQVALRPEMTPTLARMVAARANSLRKPVRWFSIPQLFRYERQQKGRLREHFQLNVDIVGEADVTADAELLAVGLEIMRAFGLGPSDVRARVSDKQLLRLLLLTAGVFEGVPAWMPRYAELQEEAEAALGAGPFAEAFAALDKIHRTPRDVTAERLQKAGFNQMGIDRLFELTRIRTLAEVREQFGKNFGVAPRLDALDRYFTYLDALGVAEFVSLDLSIVRGLAYYTGIVFELFDARGEFRAICGGGRYDRLLADLGGVDLPALGFGMGDVVLAELLRERQLMPAVEASLDFWIGIDDPALLATAMTLATTLREKGCAVEYPIREQSVAKQLKAAHAAGARYMIELQSASEGVVYSLDAGRDRSISLGRFHALAAASATALALRDALLQASSPPLSARGAAGSTNG